VIVFDPVAKLDPVTFHVATDLFVSANKVAVPKLVAPARRVTVPSGTPPFAAVTDAVKVMLSPAAIVDTFDVNVIVAVPRDSELPEAFQPLTRL
jgi:hypothetical protein